MSRYRLTREADRDIEAIGRFSVEHWGWARAETYLADLHSAFETIATYPELGRRIDHIREGYRRLERASHAIYYTMSANGVTIVRVLHGRMQPTDRI